MTRNALSLAPQRHPEIARDEPPGRSPSNELDSLLHAVEAKMSLGLSPLTATLAFSDWALHLANAPFQTMQLARLAVEYRARGVAAAMGQHVIDPTPTDHRFRDPAWQAPPFDAIAQNFLLWEAWWSAAAHAPRGMQRTNTRLLDFGFRQVLDIFSPSNVPAINPEVWRTTLQQGGANLVAGAFNYMADLREALTGRPSTDRSFVLGKDLAATEGKVVFRNELIEVLQYTPTTDHVRPEPILIVPAWIMKYYILDLSRQNSLVRYLVDQGHTVFMVSWRNPDSTFRDIGFEDYVYRGLLAALDTVGDICPGQKIHACGYCLGGTLLAITAAKMARDGDGRLATITLFCAQTDFTEAGELQLFITEDQVAFIEDMMAEKGYLGSAQMAGAFQLLRSNDLIWSRLIKTYLLGQREHANDLMAWNADGTRMPARMHSEYLRKLFLEDQLAEGRFTVDGRPVVLTDVRLPFFVVGTETDHIAPWQSVFKLHILTDAEVTFVLTSSGHNAGVVSEPGHPHRHFRKRLRPYDGAYIGPQEWFAQTPPEEGSWWPSWAAWLDARSGASVPPPATGSTNRPVLGDAPGTYVFEP